MKFKIGDLIRVHDFRFKHEFPDTYKVLSVKEISIAFDHSPYVVEILKGDVLHQINFDFIKMAKIKRNLPDWW